MSKIKTAIILAAGKGTRLESVTGGLHPKPLTPIEGTPILEYSIQALQKNGVERILIGCGHMLESFLYLESKYGVQIVENPKFDEYSSIYTLWVFKNMVSEPFYLLEADIVYDPKALEFLEAGDVQENRILTSPPLNQGDDVFYTSNDKVLMSLSKQVPDEIPEGAMTGIWALSEGFFSRFATYCEAKPIDFTEDYEMLLAEYSSEQEPIKVAHKKDLYWSEIDNELQLNYAIEHVWPNIKK